MIRSLLRSLALGMSALLALSAASSALAQAPAPSPAPPPAAPPAPAEAAPADPAPPVTPPAPSPAPEAAPSDAAEVEAPRAPVAPPPVPVDPSLTAPPAPEPKRGWSTGGAILQEDVEPSVTALHAEGLDVRLGALTQMHFAPVVGDGALLSNGDAASEAGFRVRRARLGLEAAFKWNLGAFLNLDLMSTSATDGIVSDAKVTWSPHDAARFAVGSGKVPFSRASLLSSRRLPLIERPVTVGAIAPARRLGFTAEGTVLWDRLSYLVGVMNGTDGFGAGNQFGGVLYGGRLEVRPWGNANPRDPFADGVSLGGGALYDNGPATNTLAWSADVYLALFGAFATAEVACGDTEPDDAPLVAPGVADSIERCGVYGEVGYTLPWQPLEMRIQPALRLEFFDDDRSLDNAGDVMLLTAGVNVDILDPYLRAQVNYVARREQHGEGRPNDVLFLALQGSF